MKKRKKKEYQEVPQFKDKDGFLCVVLEHNGDREVKRVHEIVALTFVNNPDNKKNVRHKDGNKENNQADNLEWF